MAIKEMTRTARAFVFLEVQLGKEQKVMEELLKFPEVKEVHEITGENDIIAVLETERDILVPTTQKIADFVREDGEDSRHKRYGNSNSDKIENKNLRQH